MIALAALAFTIGPPVGDWRTIPGGTKIELYAISNPASHTSWDSSGHRLRKEVYPPHLLGFAKAMAKSFGSEPKPAPADDVEIYFRLKLTAPRSNPGVAYRINAGPLKKDGSTCLDDFTRGWGAILEGNFGAATNPLDIAVGVADGNWRRVSQYKVSSKAWKKAGLQIKPVKMLIPHPLGPKQYEVEVPIRTEMSTMNVEYVVFNKDGSETTCPTSQIPGEKAVHVCFTIRPSDVAAIEVQERPYRWTTFRHVPVHPS